MKLQEIPALRFTGGYWQQLETVNRENTIPANHAQCEKTGRLEALKLNYRSGMPNGPHIFWDSDVAKYLEAAACSLLKFPDAGLEATVDELVSRIVRGQAPDGYFNSYFQQIRPADRWKCLMGDHELYCAGHLFEAAVAYFYATGKRAFLDAMCRYADCIATVFGDAENQKKGYPGHEEIELALVKLAEAANRPEYVRLARFFIDQRGTSPNYFKLESPDPKIEIFRDLAYFQAHIPVREQREAVGHAVRAVYLYSGMADVARLNNDAELARVCRTLWGDITQRKMHLTGGIGSTHFGEAFGAAYDLPNEEAYNETCAAIGLVFFAWRMFRMEKKSEYIDVLEQALYNGAASGASLQGTRFFYENPLACYPKGTMANGKHHQERPEWFGCSCCPPNVARLRASAGMYFYERAGDRLWINLYNESVLDLGDVRIEQKTAYPYDGKIELLFHSFPAGFTPVLRIPAYSRTYRLLRNGAELPHTLENGYAVPSVPCKAGDVLTLELDFTPRIVAADPRVRHDCGRVAVTCGPLVYCLEEEDNGADLNALRMDLNVPLEVLPGAMPALEGRGFRLPAFAQSEGLYRTWTPDKEIPVKLRWIPYFAWGNRTFGEMLVWVRY